MNRKINREMHHQTGQRGANRVFPALLIMWILWILLAAPFFSGRSGSSGSQLYSAEAAWKKAIHNADAALKQGNSPRGRFYLKKACALSIQAGTWQGVSTACKRLLALTPPFPEYFSEYVKKAVKLAAKKKDCRGLLACAASWRALRETDRAVKMIRQALACSNKDIPFLLAAARELAQNGLKEKAMQLLVRAAREAYAKQLSKRVYESASLMAEIGIDTAARHWYNKAAFLAFHKKNKALLVRIAGTLRESGAPKDAAFWKEKAASLQTTKK